MVQSFLLPIWSSFRALPGWVQVWVALLLVPINMASLFFLSEPMGGLIAVLAIGAMALNLWPLLLDRGFSKRMALPHLVPWTALVLILILAPPEAAGAYAIYLWVLLITDLISLGFDYPDAVSFLRGNRRVAGRD
jgi:hypothetical protein